MLHFWDNLTVSRKAKNKRKAVEAVEAAEEALNNEMREKYRGELCVAETLANLKQERIVATKKARKLIDVAIALEVEMVQNQGKIDNIWQVDNFGQVENPWLIRAAQASSIWPSVED